MIQKRRMRKIIQTVTKPVRGVGSVALRNHPRVKSKLKRLLRGKFGPEIDPYIDWAKHAWPDAEQVARMRRTLSDMSYHPTISIVVPVYNTDTVFLKECIESVIGQAYTNWELCLVDDASTDERVRKVITAYAERDSRIRTKFLKTNKHIAGATNVAIKMSSGEFVALFDHDDILWPNALYEVVKALNDNREIDFLYTDEDKITEERGIHTNPFFKPDWNPDFLRSVNYITHFSVIRRSLLDSIGLINPKYNGAQDWDLFLRVTSATKNIHHISKIAYSWRIHAESTAKSTQSKPYVVEAQRRAISDDLRRRGYEDALIGQDPEHTGYWRVSYPLKNNSLISIVIPSKNQYKILKRCIDSIYKKTTYDNFEIILIDTGSTEANILRYYDSIQKRHSNFTVVEWHETPFSYARSCNEGARQARGDLLVMLNNDTEVLTENWLELLAGDAQRKEIGAVGCLLFFPDARHIQHAGVGIGLGGVAANSFAMLTATAPLTQTQHLMIHTKHNVTAVTAACMAIRRELFLEIGGFDEDFRITYNDVDLCLRLHSRGYQNLYTPYVQLIHHESISLGRPEELAKRDTEEFRRAMDMFKKRWHTYIEHDPNINKNLFKGDAFYNIANNTRED